MICECIVHAYVSQSFLKKHWMLAMIFTNTATWAWRSTTDSNDRFLRETTLGSNVWYMFIIDLYSLIVTYQIFNVLILHTSLQENAVTPKISQITSDHFAKESLLESSTDFFSTKKKASSPPTKTIHPTPIPSSIVDVCMSVVNILPETTLSIPCKFPMKLDRWIPKKVHSLKLTVRP